ncbi:MAG: DEAD/DEAH box helicase family protein [Anaerolineales bacterium]|nr:DEAD/DEAH box helicase family protein [Anaerolineales bacterium]
MASKSKLELKLQRDSNGHPLSGVGSGVGLEFIKAYFPHAQNTIRIASAYFTLKGYKIGKEFILPKTKLQILVGREEGIHAKDALIKEIVDDFGDCDEDLHDAILDLLQRIDDKQFIIKDAREMQLRFHCKFYICDNKYIWHGSANYTGLGLKESAEQASVSKDLGQIDLFSEWYDIAAQEARDVLAELVERLKALTDLASPFDVYLKTLLLLNNLPDLKRKPRAKIPTYYQKGVIINAINQADKFGGGLIVAATGLGKTTIGVEIARYLLLSHKVKRVILIAPKGVMDNWEKDFDDFDIPVKYFNTSILFKKSSKNPKSQVAQLEKALVACDSETLVIIDEAHFFRNQLLLKMVKGQESSVYKRLIPAVKADAKIFLLTATVYGTNYQNLNSLLYLLPHRNKDSSDKLIPWEVKDSDGFTKLPVVTILGLPHVLKMARDRGDVDKNGRTFIQMSNEIRYLPEIIKLYSVRYDLFFMSDLKNAFDNRYFDQANKTPSFRYDDDTQKTLEGVTDTSRKVAIESWLSSPFAMLETIDKNLSAFGEDDEEVSQENKTLMYLGKKEREYLLNPIAGNLASFDAMRDSKSLKLIGIIREHCVKGRGKVIVFVNRYITARYLLTNLEEYFKEELKIGCTVDFTENGQGLKENRSEVLKKFSPYSYDPDSDYIPDEEYDVLICTDADGVGVNLQDADTVVNYDPPKSADALFQRAGRVLRMTTDPNRVVHLYRLVPSVVDFSNEESAVCEDIKEIFERITYRHEKSRNILGSSVISENEYTERRLEEEIDVEKLTREEDALDSIGGLWAESILSHTAVLEQNRPRAEELYDYILSAKTCSETTPYMFVLIEFEEKYIPILYSLKHEYVERDEPLKILDLISCKASTVRANIEFSEVEHSANQAVQAWCKIKNISLSSVRKICGLYLQPYEQAKDIKTFLKGS